MEVLFKRFVTSRNKYHYCGVYIVSLTSFKHKIGLNTYIGELKLYISQFGSNLADFWIVNWSKIPPNSVVISTLCTRICYIWSDISHLVCVYQCKIERRHVWDFYPNLNRLLQISSLSKTNELWTTELAVNNISYNAVILY